MMRKVMAALVAIAASGAVAHGQAARASAPQAKQPAAEQMQPPGEQQTKSLNLTAYAELLRSDVRTEKIAVITEVMGFTDAEDSAFWPIYREYDAEMSKLGDQRVAMIAEYATNYERLNDGVADQLARKALDLEVQRQAAKAKLYDRLSKAMSPRTALRFLQVEQQLLLLIDLQISAALPIAK